jgi:hypothetical protein
MRSFRDRSPEATVPDETLIGGSDDVKAEILKERKREAQRELRREEIARGREAEMGDRRRELERREERTMEMLKGMAAERWSQK